jgi:hypothetical protein
MVKMSPEEANLALLKANINDLALELEQRASELEKVAIEYEIDVPNSVLWLRSVSSRLKEMI